MKYYFRAECSCDSENLANLLMDRKIRFRFINEDVYSGMDVDCGLMDLWRMMNEIEDGHLMADTVNTPEKYTGGRRYGKKPITPKERENEERRNEDGREKAGYHGGHKQDFWAEQVGQNHHNRKHRR